MRIQVSFVIHRSSFILYSIFSNISLANGRTKSLRLIVSIIFFFKSPEYNLAYRNSHNIITLMLSFSKN
ncbi:uncharacterized protein OCT59_029294 [Rhizophagus irregularis]|uniref:uncharacterized protein n=1 Tax=Rhizophagus irregularis TaxID=588596 RepID=UPI000CC3467E|nr:hypothetical protein OCT59_029294 [Rhizophagus irregularis]GBC40849.1 hypothetical protein RIR_jg3020.t1 [Rhizophagus irregularis DAOM 181602=DAOM 197198]